ncbi:MAG: diguanylate cyclase [Gloeocapsa sp. DLM2.Bin57]|nr:MAG: diguanylate cyclase [Gloeocapsa sp. DLM2.Bin57]
MTIWSKLKQSFSNSQERILIATIVSIVIILLSYLGLFQSSELFFLDQFFSWRPPEPLDSRIVIVTLDEEDIAYFQEWPLSDRNLADLLTKIAQQKPRVIGLDIFRNISVKEGQEELTAVFESTPNLIGIEKIIQPSIPPNAILRSLGQVAFADFVLDNDGRIRRNLISVQLENGGEIELGLGTKLALIYLEAEGITPQPTNYNNSIELGKAKLSPLGKRFGGYMRFDNGGYQILSNYRGTKESFLTVSAQDVVNNNISANLFSDRLVLVGATAPSLSDRFFLNNQQTHGVIVHGNFASEILSAALDNRPLIRAFNSPITWVWVWLWSYLGTVLISKLIKFDLTKLNSHLLSLLFTISILTLNVIFIFSSYLSFLFGWWLIVFTPFVSLNISVILTLFYNNYNLHKIATKDTLTQVANRRHFDFNLSQQWHLHNQSHQYLSLIICDVDFFKLYNDTYGHQEGDRCLYLVAQTLEKAVRNTDLVARYGGEEFVVILPNTNPTIAKEIAQRIVEKVEMTGIPHSQSLISKNVTLSCGVASVIITPSLSIPNLISLADQALYAAKKQGRNRAILYNTDLESLK